MQNLSRGRLGQRQDEQAQTTGSLVLQDATRKKSVLMTSSTEMWAGGEWTKSEREQQLHTEGKDRENPIHRRENTLDKLHKIEIVDVCFCG